MIRTQRLDKATHNCWLAAAAFAQSSERLPVTDAEKIADALRAGPEFITRDATLCSTGHRRRAAHTGFFVKARANGPVSRAFPRIRTMSQVFRLCIPALDSGKLGRAYTAN